MTHYDPRYQQLQMLYSSSAGQVLEVDVPPLPVLTLSGRGSPGFQEYSTAAEILCALSSTLRELLEQQCGTKADCRLPLEGLWWTRAHVKWYQAPDEDRFWKLLIVQPPEVTDALVDQAKDILQQYKADSRLAAIRFEVVHEGRAAQMLHIGPYTEEEQTITQLLSWIQRRGGTKIGTHHEMYLDDARSTPTARLRTILRYPFS